MGEILSSDRFEYVAREGLGRTTNAIAHAMTRFGDHLYVGATAPSMAGAESLPRILTYHLETGVWDEVFEPDMVDADVRATVPDVQLSGHDSRIAKLLQPKKNERFVARDFGFRSLRAYKGASDSAPCVYATTMSRWGGRILRSADGKKFESVSEPGMGDDEVLSFRGLTEFDGKLFVTPVGTITDTYIDRNLTPESSIFVTDDPASGRWENACEIGFGDPSNRAVFSLAAGKDYIYAGTGNPKRGFQLWRTDAAGAPPFKWTRVLTDGAYRHSFNFATAAMVEFNGDLYVGGGIPGFGYDKANDIGPTAAELIRVHPDGSWDLIFGEPRFTPDGLKIPLSTLGSGLDNPFNSVAWSLCVHDGSLYVGTNNWQPFDRVGKRPWVPIEGGFQLWASADGENWTSVLVDGNGNPGATGVRTLCSTPSGLFVGTCNHTRLLQILGAFSGHRDDLADLPAGFEVLVGR